MTARAKASDQGGIPARWSSECPVCHEFIERAKTMVMFDRGVQSCASHSKVAAS